ncbi:MAG: hypothetical protein MUC74_06270 [Ideonella sp.]|jgi:hypothetical protein|nr:hypothetical protein [Ideonella sp.]
MAIFSFRPPASGRRKTGPTPPPDWDVTRPSEFDALRPEAAEAFEPSGFEPSGFAESGFAPSALDEPRPTPPRPEAGRSATVATAATVPVERSRQARMAAAAAVDPALPELAPNPGFAKNLTARPHNDEPLGAGWYISSWDLLQGCDVIEGAPVDLLPPEWQRKQPRG